LREDEGCYDASKKANGGSDNRNREQEEPEEEQAQEVRTRQGVAATVVLVPTLVRTLGRLRNFASHPCKSFISFDGREREHERDSKEPDYGHNLHHVPKHQAKYRPGFLKA